MAQSRYKPAVEEAPSGRGALSRDPPSSRKWQSKGCTTRVAPGTPMLASVERGGRRDHGDLCRGLGDRRVSLPLDGAGSSVRSQLAIAWIADQLKANICPDCFGPYARYGVKSGDIRRRILDASAVADRSSGVRSPRVDHEGGRPASRGMSIPSAPSKAEAGGERTFRSATIEERHVHGRPRNLK